MKHLLATAVLTGLLSLAATGTAQAAQGANPGANPGLAPSAAAPGSAEIVLVAQGCGPGGVRDRFGRCAYRRPEPYRRAACRPGTHPTPVGCRPNY